MVKNDDAHEEQSEAFLYVQESRLTDVDITSENKVYQHPNIMRFNFKPTTNLPASNHPTTPTRVKFEFPFDTGDGNGFRYDLGTGIADGGLMNCHQDGGNTVLPITGTKLECRLWHGFVDYVTIEISNFQAITVGTNDNFNLYFGNKIDRVFVPTIHLRMSLLTAKSFDLGDCHSLDSAIGQGALNIF